MGAVLNVYVDGDASGRGDGSQEKPFGSLTAARTALRKWRKAGTIDTPVRVLIAPRVYRLAEPLVFTPADGGTAACPVTWAGDGGRPLLSGARAIEGWTEGTINDRPCWQVVLPEVAAGTWWFTQLFVNGRRRLRARFPKRGFLHFAGVPEAEAAVDTGKMFHGAMSSHFVPGEVQAYRNLDDIDVVVPDHWYENHLRIASVDEATHTIHFATKGYSRFSRDETGRHTRFRLDHVAEACTDPGDWYLDRPTGTLSYIPLQGERIGATQVEAPVLDHLLSIQGDALKPARRVRHLRFEFLDLRHADWELPRDNPGALQSAFQVPAAVRFVGAEDCALYGCRVSQVAGWGVEVLRGCQRNRIVACGIHDLGGGGVKVGHEGGLTRGWVDGSHGAFRGMDAVALGWGPCREDAGGQLAGRDQADSSATTISDCSIHDGGLIFHCATGVWIGDASRNRVVHNAIWNFSYSGISCGWTWGYAPAYTYDNRIEGNRIRNIGHGILSDMGAIYTLGRQAGSTIARNYISDVNSYGYGGWGIYPDEGSSWMRITENVVCGTKCGGFHQHYGRDNLVQHNVFADSIEDQTKVSRCELVRSITFVGNVVQGSGNGALCASAGWARARVDRNVYAGDPGRPMQFAGLSWADWQAAGHDRKGRLAEAVMLDASGANPAVATPAAFRAAGIDPSQVAAVVAEAGPRLHGVLPGTIDRVRPEPEPRRAILEPLFWPWPAEWPTAGEATHPWNTMPSAAIATPGEPLPISITVENRGDAIGRGRYRLRVIPATAAKIVGDRDFTVSLKPGERTSYDGTVVATGKAKAFRIDATAEGDDLVDTCLWFAVATVLTIPRLASAPSQHALSKQLSAITALPVAGNASPIDATVRIAVADGQLLLHAEVADSAPARGKLFWDGSSMEVFAAPAPGAARRQLIVVPSIARHPAEARIAEADGLIAAPDVAVTSATTKVGWTLTVAIPLTLCGIDPAADTLALDLAINATTDGHPARAYLAGTANPQPTSTQYARLRITTQ